MKHWALISLLLAVVAGPMWADPHASEPGQPETLLPLAVGASWTWHTNYGDMTERVTRREMVSLPGATVPCDCLVVETTMGETADKIVQSEYYTLVDHQLSVVKRAYPGDETIFNPPEVVLRRPVVLGEHWSWDGDTGRGRAHLEFRVQRAERLNIPALKRSVICQKVVMQGTSDNGSNMAVTRWYAPGIGMVKEDSVMTKGQQSIVVKGVLKSYSPGHTF